MVQNKLPNIVFCTTCKNRTQHLKLTLPKNLEDNKDYNDCKFIILDYNSQDDISTYLLSRHKSDILSGKLIIYSLLPGENGPVPFHMAHAKNMAHRLGIINEADILVNLDADAFSGPNFASYISDQFSNGENHIFLQAMWNRWVEKEDGSKEWLAQDSNGEFGPPVPKGSNGRMVVSTNAFMLAGGYDEKYSTWGPDDKDFNIRLRRLGYIPCLLDRIYQDTVMHNDKVRFKEYPNAAILKGDEFQITVLDSNDTIVNYGNIGCGTVFKNFDFNNPIELSVIPTRIFGIGMHKTATNSLRRALEILGYDSVHWLSAHWAKAIWTEMINEGRSLTLEHNYALCDLPITILYKELDRVYPGSKFILTVRDETEWLNSVQRHWKHAYNKFRSAWDNDPFSHFIHKEIYGRRDFHTETFLNRYRQHNAEVIEYFKDRPSDLLVFKSDGWSNLCSFLCKSIPDIPYPVIK